LLRPNGIELDGPLKGVSTKGFCLRGAEGCDSYYNLQVAVAASPPFGGTEIDRLQLNSQEYLTPGCQVLGRYERLDTLPDIISSPGSHFAVLEYIKII
jgi:hypothetical protein